VDRTKRLFDKFKLTESYFIPDDAIQLLKDNSYEEVVKIPETWGKYLDKGVSSHIVISQDSSKFDVILYRVMPQTSEKIGEALGINVGEVVDAVRKFINTKLL